MENYYYIEVKLPLELQYEITSNVFERYSCSGTQEFSIEEERVDQILGKRSYSGGDLPTSVIDEVEQVLTAESQSIKMYFKSEQDALSCMEYLSVDYSINSKLITATNKDWNAEWKKNYKPIWVSSALEIVPEWERETYASNAKFTLYIHPGMGFGTGSHETTFLCLQLYTKSIEKSDIVASTCLDFGCGSGILGLAVNGLNSNIKIDLYDISEEALSNSQQNIVINKLNEQKIRLLLPQERESLNRKYDIVFANILQNVLLQESKYLANILTPGGSLFLSGLLDGQEKEVINEVISYNQNISVLSVVKKGDWVAIHLSVV